MRHEIRVGEVLSETFSMYGAHAGVLLPIAFWLFLLAAIVDTASREAIAVFPLAMALDIATGTLYQGVVVGLVRDVQEGRREFSMGGLVQGALPVVWPLIGAGLLSGLGIAGGFVLLIVPGLYLLTIWAVIAPAIVVERRKVFDAFGRSRVLVRGNGWPVFGVLVVTFLIAGVGGTALYLLGQELSGGPILAAVFSAISSTLTAPIAALAVAILYYRLLEIERAAPPPQPPASPL